MFGPNPAVNSKLETKNEKYMGRERERRWEERKEDITRGRREEDGGDSRSG